MKFEKIKETFLKIWHNNIVQNATDLSKALGTIFILILNAGLNYGIVSLQSIELKTATIFIAMLYGLQSAGYLLISKIFGTIKNGNGYHKDGFLVIDDDEINGALLCKGIRNEGYDCESVTDIEDAYSLILKHNYETIIIDGDLVKTTKKLTLKELILKIKLSDENIKVITIIDADHYCDDVAKKIGKISEMKKVNLLMKPFQKSDLLKLLSDKSCW